MPCQYIMYYSKYYTQQHCILFVYSNRIIRGYLHQCLPSPFRNINLSYKITMKSLPDLKRRGRKERREGRGGRRGGKERRGSVFVVKTRIKSSNLTIPSVRLLMHSEYQTLLLETEKGERERERGGGMKNNFLIILYFKIRGSSPYITSFINECCSFTTQ